MHGVLTVCLLRSETRSNLQARKKVCEYLTQEIAHDANRLYGASGPTSRQARRGGVPKATSTWVWSRGWGRNGVDAKPRIQNPKGRKVYYENLAGRSQGRNRLETEIPFENHGA